MAILFSSFAADILTVLVISFAGFYAYVQYLYGYWERRGVKYLKPTFPLGNFTDSFLQRLSIAEEVQKLYHETSEPFVGIFGALQPTLLIRDPALARRIFIKDFQYFTDRGIYINEAEDPLSGHLGAMCGEKWRNLRIKLTPLFTSGKLKAMFSTLLACGVPLKRYLTREAERGNVLDIQEIAAGYTTDIIGSTIFGIDVNTIDNPDNPFRNMGRKVFSLTFMNGIRGFIGFVYPKLQSLIKIKSVDADVEKYMKNLVRDTMEYREKNNISRNDLLQLMIQLRNTGSVQKDGVWDIKVAEDNKENWTFNEIVAQTWMFYTAGFETSSSTISFCLFELAKNLDIQRKVQQEIDEVTTRYNGEITYDSIIEMKYLEMCLDETMRKYPVVPNFNRVCTRNYTIPDTNIVIEQGITVVIPALALQRDAVFYPEPEKFIPDRFHPDNVKTFEERPYLAFGEGPRNCIGIRMGKMQTKVGLALMLQDYTYNLLNNEELKLSPKSFFLQPACGIKLKITKRVR